MDLQDAISLGQAYRDMGDAISDQLVSVCQYGDPDDVPEGELNGNALKYMLPFLRIAQNLGAEDAAEVIEAIERYESEMAQARAER